MARIIGNTNTDLVLISIIPQNSGVVQLQEVAGTQTIQQGAYDFQLPVGIYDISLYDSKGLKRIQRCGISVHQTDTTLTLQGLLMRY